MTLSMKTLFAGAAALSAIAAATVVSAATVIIPIPGGPFSLANPLAGLPAVDLLSGNTYDFTFTMADPLANTIATIQVQAQAQKSGINEPITFDLYSGDPTGTFLLTSSTGTNANLMFNPSPGDYYLEITPAYIASNKEAISGTILVSTVAEPAAWAMMLVGFGGLGVALRRRTAKTAAVAA
jgi:hypothetical protein